MEHTPGKLSVSIEAADGDNPGIFLELERYGTQATMGGGLLADRRANANHLALCWNQHDALLAELRETAAYLAQRADLFLQWGSQMVDLDETISQQIRTEASRLQARAAVIRQRILKGEGTLS